MTEQEYHAQVGKILRKKRREIEMTQGELAKKLGAQSAGFICEVEQGKKCLSAYKLFQAKQILKVETP